LEIGKGDDMAGKKIKQILVATDFSKCSVSAFKWAVHWGTKMPIKVHFFHGIAGMPSDWRGSSDNVSGKSKIEAAVEEARRAFDPWKTILEKNEIEYTFHFSGGSVSDYLATYADANPIDYIFIGAHGQAKKDRDKLGSNALDVLMKVKVPVLVTKEVFDHGDMDAVVFASNFDKSARRAFEQVLDFVRPFDPDVHLLHIDTPSLFTSTKFITEEAMEDYCKIATDFRTFKHFHKDSKVAQGIVDFCNDLGVDIIAFSDSSSTIFGSERMARPVKYLIQHAYQPVFFV
jgi:nucleotide-binding universal stress UspA family protein